MKIKTNKCLRCGFEWIARVENPKQCPRCKRYDWNIKSKNKNKKEEKDER